MYRQQKTTGKGWSLSVAAAALGSENWPKTHFRAETIKRNLTNSRPPYAGVWPQTTSRPDYLPWACLPTGNIPGKSRRVLITTATIPRPSTDAVQNLPQVGVVDLTEYNAELPLGPTCNGQGTYMHPQDASTLISQ